MNTKNLRCMGALAAAACGLLSGACGGGLSVRHLQGSSLGNLSHRVLSVAVGPRGNLWIGTDNGLARRNGSLVMTWWKSWEVTASTATAPDVGHFGVSLLTKAMASGKMGQEARVYKAKEKHGQIDELQLGQAFLNDRVMAVHVDGAGKVWAALRDRGVYVHDKEKDELILTYGLNVLGAAPTSLAEGADGTLYIGTYGGGLHAAKGGKLVQTWTPQNSELRGNGVVRSVAVHPTLGVFAATADKLPGEVKGGLPASRGTGASRLSGGKWLPITAAPNQLSSNEIQRIAISSAGAVWFAHHGGTGASILLPSGAWLRPNAASINANDVSVRGTHGAVATQNGLTEVFY